jgi:ankyrin repeat protein
LLFSVDFNIDNCRGKIVADTSFTYFHLKIAELMESMPRFNIKRYHPEEIKILALNIFPRGKTLLHYAYQNLNIVRRFYKVIDQEAAKLKEDRASKDQDVITNQGQFEIPFMRNFDGKTALHLCLIAENFKSADIILSKLCNDPLDSHARAINDIIPELVAKELPSVGTYLDSRFA